MIGFVKKVKEKFCSEKSRPFVIAGLTVVSAVLLTAIMVCLWLFVLKPGKGACAEAPGKITGIKDVGRGAYYVVPVSPKEGSIIAYMYDSGVSDRLFTEFFDTDSYVAPKNFSSLRMFADYLEDLDEAFGEDYPPYILLGIDPYAAYRQSCSNKDTYIKNLEFIRDFCNAHPYCMFLVQYPDDNASFWNSLSGQELEDARLAYITPVREFYDLINVRFIYHSVREWVLYPECLRAGIGKTHLSTDVADELLASDIMSLGCTLRVDTVNDVMDKVIEDSKKRDDVYASYADLAGKKVIFFGDSIFGNYREETAISTFFAEMTGSKVYNLGQGGLSAYQVNDSSDPMAVAFEHFAGKCDVSRFDSKVSGYISYSSYRLAASDLAGTSGKDCIIFVELGINDYLGGKPIPEFESNMEYIIDTLKTSYPEARIVTLVPGYLGKYDFGYYIMDEGGSVLPEYRDTVISVSEKKGVPYICLTDIPGFEQENWEDYILLDGIHYNENGRYRIAQYLARYFKDHRV